MTTHSLAHPLAALRAHTAPQHALAPVAGDPHDADDTIRHGVLARLRHQDGWDAEHSNVHVEHGTVVLQGLVRGNDARLAARRIAEAVPGVRRVWDARVLPRG